MAEANKIIMRRIKKTPEVDQYLLMKHPEFFEYMQNRSDEFIAIATPDRVNKEQEGIVKDLVDTGDFEILVDQTELYLTRE